MQPLTYAYWSQILDEFCPNSGRVLEIGAPNDAKQSLLAYLAGKKESDYECFGIDLRAKEPGSDVSLPYTLISGNSNKMDQFTDSSFDIVLTSSTLENDPYFWKTLAEVRRILKKDGIFAVLVPGYSKGLGRAARIFGRAMGLVSRIDRRGLNGFFSQRIEAVVQNGFLVQTSTYCYHESPVDYYRFSEDAVREVFMEGFDCIHFESILKPPRLMAVGKKLSD